MDASTLQRLEVFRELPVPIRTELAQVLDERTYADGETIFAEGTPGDTLFCVVDGAVRIEKRVAADEAATKTLSILTPGELFGEMSVFDSKPRSATARADGPAILWALPKPAFETLLAHNPTSALQLLFSLMRAMNERIRRLNSSVVVYDEIGRSIGSADHLQTLLDRALHQLGEAIGADRGLAFIQAEFHRELEVRARWGSVPPATPVELPGTEYLVGQVANGTSPWLVLDRAQDLRCQARPPRSWEGTSLILAPILISGSLLGVMAFSHTLPRRFDRNHLNLVEGIGRQIAQALLNLRHREEQHSRARMGRQFVKF